MPKRRIVDRHFGKQHAAMREWQAVLESVAAQMAEMEEEDGDDDAFAELDWLRNRNTVEFLGIWERLTAMILITVNLPQLKASRAEQLCDLPF